MNYDILCRRDGGVWSWFFYIWNRNVHNGIAIGWRSSEAAAIHAAKAWITSGGLIA